MKKRIISLAVAIATLCSLIMAMPVTAVNQNTVTFGTTYQGNITTDNRSDKYEILLTLPGRVTVNITNTGNGGLPEAGASVVWQNSDEENIRADTANIRFPYNRSMDLEPGTYFINLNGRSNYTGTYSLTVTFAASGRTAIKPNNAPETSQNLSIGQTVKGYFSHQERNDFYKYEITQPGRITLNLTTETGIGLPNGGADIVWYNSNGESIHSDSSDWTFPHNPFIDLEAGTYYINISNRNNSTGTYFLSSTYNAAGRTGIKPNHSRGIAQQLASGHIIRGYISHQERTDFYRYELTQSGRLTLGITSDTGTGLPTGGATVQWFNANGESIRNDATNWAFPYNRVMDLEAGTYFISISSRNNNTGTYTLTISDSFTQGYLISAAASPTDGGTITGVGRFNIGDTVTLEATPNSGYIFDGWYEGAAKMGTSSTLVFAATSSRMLEARFIRPDSQQAAVAAYASPPQGGIVSGGGTFNQGDTVTLIAEANEDYIFDSWYEGGVRVSRNTVLSFAATISRTLEARFISTHTQQITVQAQASPRNGGTITGTGTYNTGAAVTLRALPTAGWRFVSWEDGHSILSENAAFTFAAAPEWDSSVRTLTAVFVRDSLAVVENPHSSWAKEELERAFLEDLVPPLLRDSNTDLREPITRAEFAGIIVLTYENLSGTRLEPSASNPFSDTIDIYARMAFDAGLMVGVSENTFDPDVILTRETAATALTRVFKRWHFPGWSFATDASYPLTFTWPPLFADDALISSWARESVYFMFANDIIRGMGGNRFAPRSTENAPIEDANATREQAIAIALRLVESISDIVG